MTAETLKSFIALPSGSTYSKSKRNVNLITICVSTIFSLLCLTLLGITIFNSMRITELQRDVDSLKKALDDMHKRLGLDYTDDLNEFEDFYNNDLNGAHGDLLDSFEDDEEDDGLEEDGSGAYDDENYDDLDDDMILDDYEETFKTIPKRLQRSIITNGQGSLQESNLEDKTSLKLSKKTEEEDYQHLTIDDEDKIEKAEDTVHKRKHFRSKNRHRPHSRYLRKYKNSGRYLVKRKSSNNQFSRIGARFEDGFSHHSNFAALHYVFNGTITTIGHHPPHAANARLHHDGDVYVGHLKPWCREKGLDKPFEIDRGFVRITESGVYLIYAQVYYHNFMDRNGFFVYHNNHIFLQCALTVPENMTKGNTCYTSGVTYLEKNDVVHLRDIYKDRPVTFNERSFFGMIKLSEAK